MRFGVLGPLAVWTTDGQHVAVPGAKVRALLADLLVHAGEIVSTDRLVADLWGDRLPANPTGALQGKVSQLRRALEEAEPGSRKLVRFHSPGYVLDVDPDAVDAGRFKTRVARGRARVAHDPGAAVALLGRALELWRGPPLADFGDEVFARGAIATYEELRLTALEDHIEARLALGDHGAVAADLDALVAEHPLRERLRGQHMRALYRAGRQAEALDSYTQLRARLREELGLDPSPELGRLHQAILVQAPELDAPPAPAAATRGRTNVPVPLASLVGRDAEVTRVRELLDDARLVTLTGPAGVGKTRLAFEAARQLADEVPDGVWVVELAALAEPCSADILTRVAESMAAVLDLRDDAAGSGSPVAEPPGLVERVAAVLRERRLVLVLDNCEHVVEPVAKLADQLLGAAPDLRILATSREPLGLTGEQLCPVPPLEVPDAGAGDDPARLESSSAVRLLVQRLTAADPAFRLEVASAEAVATICRRLDGLPLALELAAARGRVLPVQELAARLDDRFRVFAGGPRTAPARQQTLQGMIDWSWELLSDRERAVLRRLAVFAGGATLEAAEAVCIGGGIDSADMLDLVARLVDRSLVVADDRAGGVRYRLLETIRAYALERLAEAGEHEATSERHARFFAELAQAGDRHLRGHDQQRWLGRLDDETPDLRAAVEWAVERNRELALRLANTLAWYWHLRGRLVEACRLLGLALEDAGEVPAAARAQALTWLSTFGELGRGVADPVAMGRDALRLHARAGEPLALAHARLLLSGLRRPHGERAGVAQQVDEALATFRRFGDRWGIAAALVTRGWLRLGRGDLPAAGRDGEEARSLFREVGDRWGQVRAAELLGQVAEIHGDYERASGLHRTALEVAEDLGLHAVVAQELSRLGRLASLAGDDRRAVELHERALRLCRELSDGLGTAFARVGLSIAARRQGRLDTAEEHLRAVLDWHRDEGYDQGVAFCLAELGFVAELRDDAQGARSLHLDGLDAARRSDNPRAIALALEGLAGADVVGGRYERGAILLGAATAARESAQARLPPAERGDVDRIAAGATRGLGDRRYTTAFERGCALAIDAAVHLARSHPGPR